MYLDSAFFFVTERVGEGQFGPHSSIFHDEKGELIDRNHARI